MRSGRPVTAALHPLAPATPRERVIVALDVPTLDAAHRLVGRLKSAVRWFKVGSELFTAAGPEAVALVLDRGGRVFLDLKFHDIPHTVGGAVAAAVRLGVSMVNVHVSGGTEMMRAAADARGSAPVFVIGVTALTSAEADVSGVVMMSRAAREAGLDGVVVSPREAAPVKEVCGGRFITVTPGIRRTALPSDDQRRTASPAAAIRSGSDFIVVGRPVLAADDPLREVESIISEVASAEVVGRESER